MRPEQSNTPPVCNYEGSDYQRRFWEQEDRAYEDLAEARALRRLLPPGQGRLLEVGAGAGRHTARYRGYRPVVLADYSRSQLLQARSRLGRQGYHYVVADAYRLPFQPRSFQAATMIRTLHHLVDPAAALGQVQRQLHPGAPFILEFANKRNLKAVLRWALGRQEWNPFSPDPVEFAELNFDFHPKAVERWLTGAGFHVKRRLAVSYLRLPALKRLLPTPLMVFLDALLQPTGRWLAFSPSMFIRAESPSPAAPASR